MELVGGLAVQIGLTGFEIGKGDRGTVALPDLSKAPEVGGIAREQGDARLVLPARRVLDGDRLDDRGSDTVDEARPGDGALDRREDAFVEVANAGCLSDHDGGRPGVGGLRRDDLVGLTERPEHGGADRGPDRVPGAQGRGDDRRSEHEPDDDQQRPCRAPSDIPDAELQEDAVADRERRDRAKRHGNCNGKRRREGAHRNAEEPLHPSS